MCTVREARAGTHSLSHIHKCLHVELTGNSPAIPQKPVTISMKFVCAVLVALIILQVSTTTTLQLPLHAIGRANRELLISVFGKWS